VLSGASPDPGRCAIRGRVTEVVYMGTSTQYAVTARDGSELLVFLQNAADSSDVAERDSEVWLSWRPEHTLALSTDPVGGPVLDEVAAS
jgi:spermidine/putrescine transport system ATP-binding protein